MIEYGLIGMFFSAMLAATLVPFGSELVLIALIHKGLDPLSVLLWATLGNWIGGYANYAIGLMSDWRKAAKWLHIPSHKVEKYYPMVHKYDYHMGFLCFLPGIGGPIGVALGVLRSNFWGFSLSMFLGKLLRYSLIVYAQTKII